MKYILKQINASPVSLLSAVITSALTSLVVGPNLVALDTGMAIGVIAMYNLFQ